MWDRFKPTLTGLKMLKKALKQEQEFKLGIITDDNGLMTVKGVIGLVIGIIVVASVLPAALNAWYGTNTTLWQVDGAEDTKTTVLWWLMPMLIVLGIVIMATPD